MNNQKAIQEIISAMSALNMEPRAIENPRGPFLSDVDFWADHAMEHLNKAIEALIEEN